MRIVKLTLFITLVAFCVQASDWTTGSFMSEPNPVFKIVQALGESKDESLTAHLSEDSGKRFSYHLSSVRYLGTISRDSRTFIVATVLFVRSSPEAGGKPPARGHGFLLMIDDKNRISATCSLRFPDQVEMFGTKLVRVGELPFDVKRDKIGDLGLKDVSTRSRGFLIDGSTFLPYPFSDRLKSPKEATGEQDGSRK